jgi:ubiquinone/menaquinone biosynthesis C-methylase UbiE
MGGKHPIFAALYDQLLSVAERKSLRQKRAELLGPLQGHVLEIGAGTGLNLLHYRDVSRLTLLEPDPAMEARLRRRIASVAPPYPTDVLAGGAEGPLSLPDGGVDAVVSTLVLCTVPDTAAALAEVRRVLVPGGPLILIEHVKADGMVGRVQNLLNPIQRACFGGCNLNRSTRTELEVAGFDTRGVSDWTIAGFLPPLRLALAGTAVIAG